jgi:hypothetical protein
VCFAHLFNKGEAKALGAGAQVCVIVSSRPSGAEMSCEDGSLLEKLAYEGILTGDQFVE